MKRYNLLRRNIYREASYMENKELEVMKAEEIIEKYKCSSLEDFDDYLTYEITKQYNKDENSDKWKHNN